MLLRSGLREWPPFSSASLYKKGLATFPVVKPTKGELQDRVETLSRRSWGVKRKPLDSLEKGHSAWRKVPRLGTSSPSPSTHVRLQGQVLPPPDEVPGAPSSQLRSAYAAKAKDPSRRAVEPPLEVIPNFLSPRFIYIYI